MELQKPNQTNLKPLDVRGAIESTSPRNKTAPFFAIRTMQEDLTKELGIAPLAPKPIKAPIEELKPLTAPPPEKLPVVSEPRPELKPPAPPEAPKVILPPPPKLPAPKIKEEAKKLFQEGLAFYKQKLYLETIEKLEKILPLKISWWAKYRAKRYLKRSRRRMAQAEQQRQKEQKQLEKKLKKEQELKLKAEEALEEKLRRERLIREEEEKKKVVTEARLAAERIRAEALKKAKQEAEAKKLEEDRKMELLRQEAEAKKTEEVKHLAEERARLEEIRKARLKMEEETKTKETEILKEEQAQVEAIRRQALEKSRLEAEEAGLTRPKEAPPAPPLAVPKPIIQPPITKPPIAPPIIPQPTKIKPKIILAPAIKIILTLLIISLGVFFYWQSRQKIIAPAPEEPTPPVIVELTPPQPLLPVDATENISIKKEALNALTDRLNIIAQKENQPGSLKRILIELTNQETSYLTVRQLIEALDLKIPGQLLANLTDDYTLFFYTQINLSESPWLAGQGRARLGLIIKIENENEVKDLMAQWEPTIKSGMAALLLGKKIPLTNNQFFQDNIYQNISIRYLNLPDRYLSIDYALINDKLLITTSQESAYEAINRIIQ